MMPTGTSSNQICCCRFGTHHYKTVIKAVEQEHQVQHAWLLSICKDQVHILFRMLPLQLPSVHWECCHTMALATNQGSTTLALASGHSCNRVPATGWRSNPHAHGNAGSTNHKTIADQSSHVHTMGSHYDPVSTAGHQSGRLCRMALTM